MMIKKTEARKSSMTYGENKNDSTNTACNVCPSFWAHNNNNNNNDPHLLVLIPHLPSHPLAEQRTPSGPALLDKLLSLNTEGGGRLISPLDRCKMSPDFRTIQKQSKNMKRNGEDRGGNLSSEIPNLVIFRTFSGMENRPFKLTHIIPEAHQGGVITTFRNSRSG